MVRVGIFGATGYAGFELLGILKRHPDAQVVFASSATYAGHRYSDVYPCLHDDTLVAPDDAPVSETDLVFLCTPHAASAPFAQRVLGAGARCVDLSADFRLRDRATYEAWYGPHAAPELLPEAVYGLTEIYRNQISQCRLVANPGCYPTGPLLALYPMLEKGIVRGEKVIIDAKSGASGAGAKPSDKTRFVTVNENFSAYKVGRAHRHVPEIEQELRRYGKRDIKAIFAPHLLPVERGILSNIYVSVDPDWSQSQILALWSETYADEPFVHVLPGDSLPTLAHVAHTNYCYVGLSPAGLPGEWVVTTALDNLVKGAAGQAVQNANVMFGLDETSGLLP